MSFGVLDICFAVVILIFAISGLIKGFIGELFGKLSFILGIFFAVVFNGKVESFFIEKFDNPYLPKIIAFLIIFIVVFVVLKILQVILQKLFSGKVLGGLDKSLGLFLGLLEGIVIVAFALYIMTVQPWFDLTEYIEQSFFNSMLSGIIQSSVSTIESASVSAS